MHALIAVQVAFCFLVLFVAGLFVSSLNGFFAPAGRILRGPRAAARHDDGARADGHRVERSGGPFAQRAWRRDRRALRNGLCSAGLAATTFFSIHAEPPKDPLCFFLSVSPGFLDAMKIPLLDGRDFLLSDLDPGAAIVNETFVKTYYNGENPSRQDVLSNLSPTRVPILDRRPGALNARYRSPGASQLCRSPMFRS